MSVTCMDSLKQFEALEKYKALIYAMDIQMKMTSQLCGFELRYPVLRVLDGSSRPRGRRC